MRAWLIGGAAAPFHVLPYRAAVQCFFIIMALFGFHLVLTMIVASFVHKITPYYSFGKWFITQRLKYYTLPPDHHLHTHIISEQEPNKHRNKTTTLTTPIDDKAIIKRTSTIQLNPRPLTPITILFGYYFTELRWLLDLLIAVLVVFISTFIFYWIKPEWHLTQTNLSAAWVMFILIYTLILLYSLMLIYFSDELAKERITQVVLSATLFVCALTILLLDDLLDFNLRQGHHVFINAFLATANSSIDKDVLEYYIPFWSYIVVLVLISTLIGSMLVFPSLNYARLHFETLKCKKGFLIRTLSHFNYILPLICMSLWFKPMTNDATSSTISNHMSQSFPIYRLVLVNLFCILRFLLFQPHMSIYLNRANLCFDSLKATTAKILVGDLKKKVNSILSFYCGSALQYLGPVVVLLALHLLSIISSHYLGLFPTPSDVPTSLFNLSVYSVPISFLCWWVCFVMFFISSIGSLIHTYIQ